MIEERFTIMDCQWALIEPHCLGKKSDPGRIGGDGRLFLEAVLWIARTGSPWRDLPPGFGTWNTLFKRFRHWVKADVLKGTYKLILTPRPVSFTIPIAAKIKHERPMSGCP